jgi:2-methylisocitrate lyase-like PEP mutase family enzyme
MRSPSDKRDALKKRLTEPKLLSVPGVFDMISAKLADAAGFDALYMTGYGIAASYLGLPDAGLATYTDMVGRAHAIATGTRTPLIADGDTGYGGLLNVDFTVRGYEAAGVQAIQIEDQEFPKKCGHTPGRRVIAIEDAVRKIRVAVAARSSRDFLIIARTDARSSLGLDEALRRAEAFATAGADILFVESPESEAEMVRIGRAFNRPLVANMVEGGRTPIKSRTELEQLGFKIALFPVAGFLAMGAALRAVYGEIKANGSTRDWTGEMYRFDEFSKLMGFERVWAFEREHAEI